MNMEYWWNDTDKGKPKYWEINLFHCHCVYHSSHMDWVMIEPGPPPILTLRLLMSYIYGAPSKARNANVVYVYIWTYVWQR